jgi:hypothetical protein
MFAPKGSFSSFSVDDVARAREFYGQTLGLSVSDGAMGTLELSMPEGHTIFVYPKDNHFHCPEPGGGRCRGSC